MSSKGTLNKVMLIGNLGDNVKTYYFDNGDIVARFSIATSEAYTNKDGQIIENTEWHNIVVRNRLAEVCEKYLHKGDKVYVEGKIRTRQWTSKDNSKEVKYATEIIALDLTFLSPKKDKEQALSTNNKTYTPSQQQTNTENKPSSQVDESNSKSNDDDLPF